MARKLNDRSAPGVPLRRDRRIKPELLHVFTPFSELDQQIAKGWGDTPGLRIPANWRDVKGPSH